jgi:hypothetical protein
LGYGELDKKSPWHFTAIKNKYWEFASDGNNVFLNSAVSVVPDYHDLDWAAVDLAGNCQEV